MDNFLYDLLVYSSSSPGDTARVISNNYFSKFYTGVKDYKTAIEILENRNQIYVATL